MRCEEFENRLNQLLDERLHPRFDALVSRHARLCSHCRNMLTVYGIVLDEVPSLELPVAANDLPQRVLECVGSSPLSDAKNREYYGSSWVWATTAALVLAVILFREQKPEPIPPPVALATPAVPRPQAPAMETAPAVGDLARQATDRYADLARDTSGALAHVALLLPGSSELPSLTEAPGLSASGNSSRVMSEVAAGFKPLADSTAGAVNFLFQVLPLSPTNRHAEPVPGSARAI